MDTKCPRGECDIPKDHILNWCINNCHLLKQEEEKGEVTDDDPHPL